MNVKFFYSVLIIVPGIMAAIIYLLLKEIFPYQLSTLLCSAIIYWAGIAICSIAWIGDSGGMCKDSTPIFNVKFFYSTLFIVPIGMAIVIYFLKGMFPYTLFTVIWCTIIYCVGMSVSYTVWAEDNKPDVKSKKTKHRLNDFMHSP